METQLAIVIPAYKKSFFHQTLESIANQTNKSFTVYIGDDCSPDDLEQTINYFRDKIPLVYKRFEDNLGSLDLVAHWERCLGLIGNEQWVWLFSDDDIMENNCVEQFYRALKSNPNSKLFHFNVDRIDENSVIVFSEKNYNNRLTTSEFTRKMINFDIRSYVVEYVFNLVHFKSRGGFEKFDLAWGTDHATWIKLSVGSYINTIPDAKVYWRMSGKNITSINGNKLISKRKKHSELLYFEWLNKFFSQNSIPLPFTKHQARRWFIQGIIVHVTQHGMSDVSILIDSFSKSQKGKFNITKCYLYLFVYLSNFYLKRIVKGEDIFFKFK